MFPRENWMSSAICWFFHLCFWFCLTSLHKIVSHWSRSRVERKWKSSDPSDSNAVTLPIPLTTLFFDLHTTIRFLLLLIPILSLVQTSLKKHKVSQQKVATNYKAKREKQHIKCRPRTKSQASSQLLNYLFIQDFQVTKRQFSNCSSLHVLHLQ